jgi:hypothetical protein
MQFWFGGPAMDANWFQQHIAATVAQAGDRYTRESHVELPLASRFDALGYTR